jgi:hypothetical protein
VTCCDLHKLRETGSGVDRVHIDLYARTIAHMGPRVGILALSVLLLAGCGATEPAKPTALTTHTEVASAPPPPPPVTTSTSALANVDFSDEADARFLAALKAKGVTLDEDDMVLAGQGVCLNMLNEGQSLIEAAAWVMDSFEVPGDRAGDIATSAVDVYCPKAG